MKLNSPIFAILLLSASTAAAQPGGEVGPPPTGPASPMPPSPPPAPSDSVERGVLEDANSGRTWLAPTALTAPAGTFSFSDWQLFWVGAGYSPTDKLSLSASTMIPLTSDFPIIIFATGKLQLLDAGRLKVAGHAGFLFFNLNESDVDGDETFTAASLGGVATYCLDDDCHSVLNGFIAGGFALEYAADQTSVPFGVSAAYIQRLTRMVKLILEVDSGFVAGEFDAAADGFLGWYGVRFTSKNIGVDLGLVKLFCDGCDSEFLPLGYPVVNFTYRSL